MSHRLRGLLLAVVIAAIVVSALAAGLDDGEPRRDTSPRAAAPAPVDFIGLVSEDVIAGDLRYRRRVLRQQADAGVRLLRQTFDWSQIEPRRGRYDFRRHDAYVEAVAGAGLELLPVLFGTPRWATSAPRRGGRPGTYPPRRPADMARFAAALTRRYGPDGSFWREHPRLEPRPVRSWQVWNEPNLPAYWPAGPDPGAYLELLRAVGGAIRRVDPSAEIVTAGLPNSRLGVPFDEYLEGLYRAGARGTFQSLAVHGYAREAADVVAAVAAGRQIMRRNGDRATIWITETGWASGGPRSEFTVDPDGQARRVSRLLRSLAAERGRLGIRGLVYFNWRDATPYPGGRDFWGLHTGLLDLQGRRKPAFAAFRRAAAAVR